MAQARGLTSPAWRPLAARLLPWLFLACAVGIIAHELNRPSAVLLFWPAWCETGALALALTPIILTGGIDLSVGSIIALSGVVLAALWHDYHWPMAAAALSAVGVGMLAGAVNASLVVAGIPSLVATLATMAFYAGLALAISGGQRVGGFPAWFAQLGQERLLYLPTQFWMMLAVFVVAWVGVHQTRFGRYLFAIGDNRRAATFAAVPVRRLEWWLYTASGLVAGLVAVFYTARSEAAIPSAGQGQELSAIACVVVGGTRVTGGYGGVGRTLLGVAAMSHLDIALQFAGSLAITMPWSDEPWQPSAQSRLVILGALVVAMAVWNERLASREN